MSTLKKAGRTTGDRNEVKRAIDNAKKEYLENISNKIWNFKEQDIMI